MNFGYNDGGIPDTRFGLTVELTLHEAARRTTLPRPQVYFEKIDVSFLIFKAQKIFNIFQPIGFIFKEKEVLCMKCGRQFKCPTTEKKVVYNCHARVAWSGHPRVIDAETYILKIVGKEVFVPHRVEFDRYGIELSTTKIKLYFLSTKSLNHSRFYGAICDSRARFQSLSFTIQILNSSNVEHHTRSENRYNQTITFQKIAEPLVEPESLSSNSDMFARIRHLVPFDATSRQSTGTTPGTSGPPPPTSKPSASSLKKQNSKSPSASNVGAVATFNERRKSHTAGQPHPEAQENQKASKKRPEKPSKKSKKAKAVEPESSNIRAGQPHPESLENQKEPEYITLSDDENDPTPAEIEVLAIVKDPRAVIPRSLQIARVEAAVVLGERDEPPRRRYRRVSDDSDIEIIEDIPEFDPPTNGTEPLAPEAPNALKRAGSPVEMISAKRFSKDDSPDVGTSVNADEAAEDNLPQKSSPIAEEPRDEESGSEDTPMDSAAHPEASSSSKVKKNPEDNDRDLYDFIFTEEPEDQSSKQKAVAPKFLLKEEKSVPAPEHWAPKPQDKETEVEIKPEEDQEMIDVDQNNSDVNEASRGDQSISDDSEIEIIEDISRGAQAPAPGPEFDPPTNCNDRAEVSIETEPLAPVGSRQSSPVFEWSKSSQDEEYNADSENFVENEEPEDRDVSVAIPETQKDSEASTSGPSHADETNSTTPGIELDVEMVEDELEMDSIPREPEIIKSRESSPKIPILESNGQQDEIVLDEDMDYEEDISSEDDESQEPSPIEKEIVTPNASRQSSPVFECSKSSQGEDYDAESEDFVETEERKDRDVSVAKPEAEIDSEPTSSSAATPDVQFDVEMAEEEKVKSISPEPEVINVQITPILESNGHLDVIVLDEDMEDKNIMEDQYAAPEEDNSLEELEEKESQEPSPIKSQEDIEEEEDLLHPATESDDGSDADGKESDEDVENEKKLEDADLDQVDMNSDGLMSPGSVYENISEIISENPDEESLEDMNDNHPREKSPDLESAEPHNVESEKLLENQNDESDEDMDDSLADERTHQSGSVSEEPDVEMEDEEDPEGEEDVTATEQPLVVETFDVTVQKTPESPTTCSPILRSLLLDQSPKRRTMSADPNLEVEEVSEDEEPQDVDAREMEVENSNEVEPELETPGVAPKDDGDVQMEVDVAEEEVAEKKEEKEDAKPTKKELVVTIRPRGRARVMFQIDRGTSIPTGLTRKPFHFEVKVKSRIVSPKPEPEPADEPEVKPGVKRGRKAAKKEEKEEEEDKNEKKLVPVGPEFQAELPEIQESGDYSSDEESEEEEIYWEPLEDQQGGNVDERDMAVYQRAILLTFNGHIPMEKALGHLRNCGFDFGDALDSIDQCLKELPQAMKPICYGQAKQLAEFLMRDNQHKFRRWRRHIQEQAMRNYHIAEIHNFLLRTMIPKYVNHHVVLFPDEKTLDFEPKWMPRGELPCTCNFFTHEDIVHESRISCTNCTKMFRNVDGLPEQLCLLCQAYEGFKGRRRPAENVVFNGDESTYLRKWDVYEKTQNCRISKEDFDKVLLEEDTARWMRMELTEEERDIVDWTATELKDWNDDLPEDEKTEYGEEVAAQLKPFEIPFLSRCRCKESGSIPRHSENSEKWTFEEDEKELFRDAILKHDGDQMAAAEELDVEAELVERFAQLFPSGSGLYKRKKFVLRPRPILPHTNLPPPPPIPIVFKKENVSEKQRRRAKGEIDEDYDINEEKDSDYDPNENKMISQAKAKKKRAAAAAAAKAAAKKKPAAPKKPPAAAPKPPSSAPRKPPTERQPPPEPQVSARELRARARQ
ncbi:hypothetical protein CRE_17487 [Caenorhabditis remanei]|uniref:ELM2 domain-containing protein n=1 Tax=Caenorhabditis remanei TaxID=31234 RepID=E3N7V0_CAERE|nr:hypothetical protein CRE_17487 [Caenorhabditis remanei]